MTFRDFFNFLNSFTLEISDSRTPFSDHAEGGGGDQAAEHQGLVEGLHHIYQRETYDFDLILCSVAGWGTLGGS